MKFSLMIDKPLFMVPKPIIKDQSISFKLARLQGRFGVIFV